MYFLTTTHSLPIPGVILGGEGTFSEGLGWSVETYRETLQELLDKGMRVRVQDQIVWLSNGLKYNPPSCPNNIKTWGKTFDDIPDSALKSQIYEAMKDASKRWRGVFSKEVRSPTTNTYHQPSLDLFEGVPPTRTPQGSAPGSGSGTGSGSVPGSGSLSTREREKPENPDPDLSADRTETTSPKLTVVPLDDRTAKKQELVRMLGPAHAKAFAAVKHEIGSTAFGPGMADSFTELRDLLDSFPSLADAKERCEHALAIRETEARRKRTMQYFGSAMWKRQNFEKALSLELADVDGTREQHSGNRTGECRDVFAVVDGFFDDMKRKENA